MIHRVLKTQGLCTHNLKDIRTRRSVLNETTEAGSCPVFVCRSSPGSWSQENAGAASGPTTVRISGGQTAPTHTHTQVRKMFPLAPLKGAKDTAGLLSLTSCSVNTGGSEMWASARDRRGRPAAGCGWSCPVSGTRAGGPEANHRHIWRNRQKVGSALVLSLMFAALWWMSAGTDNESPAVTHFSGLNPSTSSRNTLLWDTESPPGIMRNLRIVPRVEPRNNTVRFL